MATDYTKDLAAIASQNTYTPSSDVNAAYAELENVKAGKPAEYSSSNSDQLGALYDSIMNAGDYSFDMATDGLYNQYKEAYQQQGKKAALDTMNNAGAMAGGYGTTWAQAAAGNQYGEYLKGLNDALPSIENIAYTKYTNDQDRLNNLYQTALEREATDYGRYRDAVTDWQNDREFAANAAQQAYSDDYNRYSNNMSAAQTLAGWNREDQQQAASDAYSWAMSLIQQGILPNADILATAGISSADALALAKKYGYTGDKKSSSGSSGSSGKKKSSGGTKKGSSSVTPTNDFGVASFLV